MSNLAQRIASFLEYQKEMYGPFQPSLWDVQAEKVMPTSAVEQLNDDSENKSDIIELPIPDQSDLINLLAEIQTLDDLHEWCKSYEPLRTDLEGTNLVFGVGNPHADLLLVGEAPGENEDIQGEPFVGKAGLLLNKIIAAIGFTRDDVYIANILKHRPPNNRDPFPEERQRSLPVLIRQIELINPKIILCLGRISAQTLLGTTDPMKDMRAKFHDWRGFELTVTYHPAALLRNPNWKPFAWEDVQMVRARYDELGGKP